jgi:hypothetical protein
MNVGTPTRVTSPQATRALLEGYRAIVDFTTTAVRDAEVIVENLGPGDCEIERPDGRIMQPNVTDALPAGNWSRLTVPEGWDRFRVTITAGAGGTTIRAWVDGEPVPMVRGKQKVPQRDPQTGLIVRVLESDTWVPRR